MFNITNDKRRATVDIDIDLIRYSLEDKSILLLFDKLNQIDDGIKIIVNKKIKPLKHQDYHGKRVNIALKDSFGNQIETKIDIGVHNNLDIEQEEYMFNFEVFNNCMTLLSRILTIVGRKMDNIVELSKELMYKQTQINKAPA